MAAAKDGGIVAVGGGASLHNLLNHRKGALKTSKITVIMASDFLEWSLGATSFTTKPDTFHKFVSVTKSTFEYDGIDYVYDPVTEVKPAEKLVTCKSGRRFTYKVLVVATGYHVPIIHREPGIKLAERYMEVQHWGSAIKSAKTVVVNGSGSIGLEWACDIKLEYKNKRVVILSRSGNLLSPKTSDSVIDLVKGYLADIGVEVITGTPSDDSGISGYEPISEVPGGKFRLADGSDLECNLFLPAFVTKINTDFLPEATLTQSRLKFVDTNPHLQAKSHPEIFAIGVNSSGEGFSSPLLQEQAKSVVKNINNFLDKKALEVHEAPKELRDLDWGANPSTIKLGYAKGGYMIWQNMPAKQMCCVRTCGFPVCPLLCCFPCLGGWDSLMLCGSCCSNPAGKMVMDGYISCCGIGGVKCFPKMFGMKGFNPNNNLVIDTQPTTALAVV